MATTLETVIGKSFDYVIVGGGTAGLVLAARLTDDSSVSVVVLEAGADHGPEDASLNMSGTFAKNFGNPQYDWCFATVPQVHSDGNVYYWARGKGLGGTSGMNFYVFNRPEAEDINAIEELGNPGWNWDTFLKYSKKTETFYPPPTERAESGRLTFDPEVHGNDGPIATSYSNVLSGLDVHFQDVSARFTLLNLNGIPALFNLSVPYLKDSSGGNISGSTMSVMSIDPQTNKRSFAVEYLKLAEGRDNLTVLTAASVSKVLTSPATSVGGKVVAKGAQFVYGGVAHGVSANKEVILSAGAIKSPHILELSGIGDEVILSSLGIPTTLHLPGVGKNVQEHMYIALSFELDGSVQYNTMDPLRDPDVIKEQLRLYTEGKGLFLLGSAGYGFVSLDTASPIAADLVKAQAEKLKALKGRLPPGLEEQYDIQLDKLIRGLPGLEIFSSPIFLGQPNPSEPGKQYMNILVVTNHNFSRGTIRPAAPPSSDPHYFEDDFDLKTYVELVKFARKLSQIEPLTNIIVKEVNPGPAVQTDEQIGGWIKKHMGSLYHTAGSCSMLPHAKDGVVDPHLKVYGTANLRVVDLSVLPLHISAHTQAYVYALAEQAADIIKGAI